MSNVSMTNWWAFLLKQNFLPGCTPLVLWKVSSLKDNWFLRPECGPAGPECGPSGPVPVPGGPGTGSERSPSGIIMWVYQHQVELGLSIKCCNYTTTVHIKIQVLYFNFHASNLYFVEHMSIAFQLRRIDYSKT